MTIPFDNIIPPPTRAPLSTRQRLIVLVLSTSLFITWGTCLLLGPFFPEEARSHGVSTSVQGIIFGQYAFGQFVFCPIWGKLTSKIGCRRMLSLGLVLAGIFNILFGLVTFLPPIGSGPLAYVLINSFIRLSSSVCAAPAVIASFTVVSQNFDESRILFLLGLLESMSGAGCAVGPAIGSLLFQVGGYFLPFAVMGVCSILTGIAGAFIIPPNVTKETHTEEPSMVRYFLDPRAIIMVVAVILSGICLAIYGPILEPFLRPMGMAPYQVGLVFGIFSAGYMGMAPVISSIIKRTKDSKNIMIVGCLLTVLTCLAVGPSPIFCLEPRFREILLIVPSLAIFGAAQALILVPTFDQFLGLLGKRSLSNNSATFGVISGVWNSAYALGDCLGPATSGFLYDVLGFQWTLSVYALLNIVLMILLATLMGYEHYGKPYWKRVASVGSQEETKFLIEVEHGFVDIPLKS